MNRWLWGLIAAGVSGRAWGQQCSPYWASLPRIPGSSSDAGYTAFDNGAGMGLVRTDVGARLVHAWNGWTWNPVTLAGTPSGFDPAATVAFRDGPQEHLFLITQRWLGTRWAYNLSRWDAAAWVDAGMCLSCPGGSTVFASTITGINLGDGLHMFAVSYENPLGTQPDVVRWDGSAWTVIGRYYDVLSTVDKLFSLDDGTGPKLYAIGDFIGFNGILQASGIAMWDGSEWHAVDPDHYMRPSGWGAVEADLGDGPALYVLGQLSWPGLPWQTQGVNKFDGHRWSHVGHPDAPPPPSTPPEVLGIAAFTDSRGTALYITGNFGSFNGVPMHALCRYDLQNGFQAVPGVGPSELGTPVAFGDPRGPALFVQIGTVSGGTAPGGAMLVGCPSCYANCDASSAAPTLNVNDFICFLQTFSQRDPYANCDGSTATPALNVNDFICFMTRFAAGCSAP